MAEPKNEIESFQSLIMRLSSVVSLRWMLAVICEAIVSKLGYKMVWIGLKDKATNEVKPVMHKGFEEGYLSSIQVRCDDSLFGRGPTGTAIRMRKTTVQRDILGDPSYAPWREEALKRGYRASAALPLWWVVTPLGH